MHNNTRSLNKAPLRSFMITYQGRGCQIKKEDFHNGNLYKARQLVPAPGLLRVYPGGQADHEVEDMDAHPRHDSEAD